MSAAPVLLTWVAVNNDPYERDGQSGLARLVDGAPIPGPTLTLLCDAESPYAGRITDVVLFHRSPPGGASEREERAVTELGEVLRKHAIRAQRVPWDGDDPMSPAEAVEYGLEALLGPPAGEARATSMSVALAHAFSSGNPIDDLLEPGGRIATAEVLADFRAFIAAELRRIAAARVVPVDELCDVSERSIREWAKGRQLSSANRKPASESDEA